MNLWERMKHKREINNRLSLVQKDVTVAFTTITILIVLVAYTVFLLLLPRIAYAETIMYVATKKDSLAIRRTSDIHASIEYRLDKGSAVIVHKTYRNWAYVERVGVAGSSGDFGWCVKSYLSEEAPAVPVPENFWTVDPD